MKKFLLVSLILMSLVIATKSTPMPTHPSGWLTMTDGNPLPAPDNPNRPHLITDGDPPACPWKPYPGAPNCPPKPGTDFDGGHPPATPDCPNANCPVN